MVKHFTCGCRIIMLISALLLLYVVAWLQGGERDMNWARGWLTSALNPSGAPYEISIGDVSINWESITEFGNLRVENMRVSQKDGAIFATLPEVKITLDPIGFLPHRRSLHGIEIDHARLFLIRDGEGVVRVGLDGVQQALPLAELIGFFGSDDSQTERSRGRLPFRQFAVDDAMLTFNDTASDTKLVSSPFSFRIRRIHRDVSASLAMPFTYNEQQGSVDVSVYTQPVSDERVLNARFDNVPAELACMVASCPAGVELRGNVTGKINLRDTPDEEKGSGTLNLATSNAVLTAPEWFPAPVKIKQAGIVASADNNFDRIVVESASASLEDTKVSGAVIAQKREDGWYVRGKGKAGKLSIAALHKYWPMPLASASRAWVTSQLTDGYAAGGDIVFDLTPQDIAGDTLRDKAIHSTINARAMTVNYLPGFPLLKDVNGTVVFTARTMHIEANSGKMLTGTTVQSAILDCHDLDAPGTPMKTTLVVAAPAADVATILRLKPFTFDDGLNLDPATITGSTEATLKLGFDGFSENPSSEGLNLDAVTYDITAALTNIAQKQLLKGRDIVGLSGTLAADDKNLSFAGTVKLDGTNMAFSLKDVGGTTIASAKGTLARSQFANYGIPDLPQIGEGSMGIDAEVALGKDNVTLRRADLDLTPIALTIDQISWSKPAGTAAKLSVTPKSDRSYGVAFTASDLSIGNATLQLNTAMNDVAALDLPRVKSATNDFSLNYKTTANGFDVTLKGAKLDNSTSFAKSESGLLADFPPINLLVDIGELVLVKDNPLRSVKGTLSCTKLRCNAANLTAKAGAGSVQATIAPIAGVRQLNVQSDNAGDLLRALDISDRMFGGQLNLTGKYADAQTPAPMNGRIMIHQFKLRNSEILARIISIGSLSGLANMLTGQGIDFEKMGVDIQALAGVMTLDKGQITSNALGLTVSGKVDTAKSDLNLKGVVVPANSLNSLFGKIPLIGALAGGPGEGLIAFNYSVKGPMDNPDVFVNPLSGLTPGFLRGIFNIGDDGATAPAADAPTPPETPTQP